LRTIGSCRVIHFHRARRRRVGAALKKSGLTWTEDNLRAWIADPSHTVPGTLMPHVSLSDPAEQLYVIAYLKTLSGKAAR
jgi:cytochrome c2